MNVSSAAAAENPLTSSVFAPVGRRWLWMVLALITLVTLVFYFLKIASVSADNRRSAAVFEQSLRASIDQFEYLPALLARNEKIIAHLRSAYSESTLDDLTTNNELAFSARRSGADIVYVLRPDGRVTAASNYQDKIGSFVGHNYGFRPYFARVMATGERQFYFAKGMTTGIPGFFISSPVRVDDRIIGVVVVKLELASLLDSWESSHDRVLVSDANGVIILASDSQWLYRLLAPLPIRKLNQVYRERQFPEENHELLFQPDPFLSMLPTGGADYWKVDGKTWLVDHFPVNGTDWTLHHVVSHRQILLPTLACFFIVSLLGCFWYLLMRERQKKAVYSAKVRQTEIRRREDLQRLIDHIHIGVLVFDGEGCITSMNDYAENLLLAGASFNENGVANVVDLLRLKSLDGLDSYLVDLQRTPQYFETWTRIGESPVPVMFALARVDYDNSEHYLMTLINIVRRKRAEEQLVKLNASLASTVDERTRELKVAQQELLQKSKAAALGNMAATIVHELSQPLAAINSSVAAIEGKVKRENWSGAMESAARLKPLGSKMRDVIQLLKSFSYDDSNHIGLLDVATLIQQMLDLHHDQWQERGIQIELIDRLVAPANRVNMSAIKFDLAVSNLLKNAMEALEKTASPRIRVELSATASHIQLVVEDNGGGLDDAVMEHLFSPWFTTKEVGKGVGLGLSIVYEIVQQQHGDIHAENISHDGAETGARFTLQLPLAVP
ncbi:MULTISPECIES: ATP-binding protein [unclassified Oceanobacter]|uniref:sensor histidine kinase n=1 Tax=unclassified Oceanobacter TaxID=2620260 RepID=UPI0026E13AA8|nr:MULTISPECIES: ATP-binding protein [unclassified Oceanobacter]MDO6682197.1 ATP-binding protein [Oceanobacter sp. 5_MG-2023]MDP2504930.1 ATP-binding protein [Oceanobacter sp. 3_MG-2023]